MAHAFASNNSLVQALKNQVNRHADKVVLTFLQADQTVRTVTYAQLDHDATQYAQALHHQGVAPRDVVALIFDHGYALVAAFWGAVYLGAVPTIFPYVTPQTPPKIYKERVEPLLKFSQAKAILTDTTLNATLSAHLAGSEYPILTLDEGASTTTFHNLFNPVDGIETAYIQFSGGTTGRPKGVVLSHQAVLNHVQSLSASFPFRSADVSVGWLPLYHDMGLVTQLLLPLLVGGTSVFIPPAYWIRHPESLFQAIDKYKGTMSWMPNFAFSYCARRVQNNQLQELDLSSWSLLGNGSEPVQLESLQLFTRRFEPYGFQPNALMVGYGMAENVVGLSVTLSGQLPRVDWISIDALQTQQQAIPRSADAEDATPILSCGYPIRDTEIEVVDAEGNAHEDRHVGEVIFTSNALMTEYYRQPDLTAQTLRDDWLYTGDLGYKLDGQLYICGRLKDVIIVEGKNIQPHYIESIAQTAVGSAGGLAAAFGIFDEQLGTERPVLVCELLNDEDMLKQNQLALQIRQRVFEQLAISLADIQWVPKGWIIKTTSSKVSRTANRQKYMGEGRQPATPTGDKQGWTALHEIPVRQRRPFLFGYVSTQTAEILGLDPITLLSPRQGFFELGITSLQSVALKGRIEIGLGCRLPDTAAFDFPTLDTLVDFLLQTLFPQEQTEALSTSSDEIDSLLSAVEALSEEDAKQKLIEHWSKNRPQTDNS
ncbi:MAG: AMP-binding protein [Anaerolineae bacterium]|nr:AMP-binding protein [Anaerolineae bacterium]